jgi:hypothetical protein
MSWFEWQLRPCSGLQQARQDQSPSECRLSLSRSLLAAPQAIQARTCQLAQISGEDVDPLVAVMAAQWRERQAMCTLGVYGKRGEA